MYICLYIRFVSMPFIRLINDRPKVIIAKDSTVLEHVLLNRNSHSMQRSVSDDFDFQALIYKIYDDKWQVKPGNLKNRSPFAGNPILFKKNM